MYIYGVKDSQEIYKVYIQETDLINVYWTFIKGGKTPKRKMKERLQKTLCFQKIKLLQVKQINRNSTPKPQYRVFGNWLSSSTSKHDTKEDSEIIKRESVNPESR